MRRLRKKKGQSTVEYVIVFTAIAAAIIFAATQLVTPNINKSYSAASNKIGGAADYFSVQAGFNRM